MEKELENAQNNNDDISRKGISRRSFLFNVTLAGVGYTLAPLLLGAQPVEAMGDQVDSVQPISEAVNVKLTVNGKLYDLSLDPRITLLDTLREKLQLTGSKKGCDHGQCGACTVLVNGRRVNSCLTLAAVCQGASVISIEGLANGDTLHPMQAAFIKHDAFQCGYCTPGQICSAVGLLQEGHAYSEADVRELMSGNICRCGAYQNIKAAIMEVKNA